MRLSAGDHLAKRLQPLGDQLNGEHGTPVRLPLGRARLVTRPSQTGSLPTVKTIGIVEVAFFAAAVGEVPKAAIKSTLRRTRSRPTGAADQVRPPPSGTRSPHSVPQRSRFPATPGRMKSPHRWGTNEAEHRLYSLLARAESGHAAAAPPSSTMRSRRLMPRPPMLPTGIAHSQLRQETAALQNFDRLMTAVGQSRRFDGQKASE